jgi:saccharopine dehydrogenase-like NADP-dependent oxidoreductase
VRILVVGTGGRRLRLRRIARRRSFFEHCALADHEPARPRTVLAGLDDGRFSAHRIDASSREDVGRLIRETSADAVLNAVEPVFNMPIFEACLDVRVTYLDMALSLSQPHPERPYETYLSHVVDNEWSLREYGSQAVVWQTALNPVIALELLAAGEWKGVGVLGPEAFPAQPLLAKLAEYGSPHGILELA